MPPQPLSPQPTSAVSADAAAGPAREQPDRRAGFFHSLRFRFILSGVLLVIIGTAVRLGVSMPYLRGQVEDLAANQLASIATYIARDVDYGIASRLALVQRLATHLAPVMSQSVSQQQAWLRDRQQLSPLFNSGLMLVRPSGEGLLAQYPVLPGREKLDFRQSDWFLQASRSTSAVMGRPVRGRIDGDPLMIMAAPIRDERGELLGVLAGVALLQAPGFLDRLQETRLGNTGGFLLVDPQNKVFVASSDPGMVMQPTPALGVNLLHDRAMAGFRGTGVTVNAKGVEELAAMVSVPSAGWFVVARMPTKEAFQPVMALRRMAIGTTLLVLVVMAVLVLLLLHYLLRPLLQTAAAFRDMADGRRELEELPEQRRDEVGQLVRGFNQLVRRLQDKERALLASEARLAFMAQHDPLTGLPNRTLFEDRFEQALKRCQRHGTQLALLFCDLDGFKLINDLHGHQVGDKVLREVAARLSIGRRAEDTVARLGGDEFVLLLSDQGDARTAARLVGEQCLHAVSEPYVLEEGTVTLGLSIGVAVHQGGGSAAHLLTLADSAMYQAKRAGKGRLVFVSEDGQDATGSYLPPASNPENHS